MKTVFFGLGALVLIGSNAFASKAFYDQFKGTYADFPPPSCKTCHTRIPQLNPYGIDFQSHDHDLAKIEAFDSDGDGYSNLDEIKAGTNPGDKESHPGQN